MYAKHGNLVDAGASGSKASTKHLESCLEVIQGHAFWDHWKSDEGLLPGRGFRVYPYPRVYPTRHVTRGSGRIGSSLSRVGSGKFVYGYTNFLPVNFDLDVSPELANAVYPVSSDQLTCNESVIFCHLLGQVCTLWTNIGVINRVAAVAVTAVIKTTAFVAEVNIVKLRFFTRHSSSLYSPILMLCYTYW